ncbi:MAG: L-histidine N(alpha)-methyltransferase [Sneathiella sp.]
MSRTALRNFHDFEPAQEDFRSSVLNGLSKPQKTIASKFFYDANGSALFDQICDLPEYYPTRTELYLLQEHSEEIAGHLGTSNHLIEFGSGSSVKISTLLNALHAPLSYVPMDISKSHLLSSAKRLSQSFPDLPIIPICADYTTNFDFPDIGHGKRTGFFPGSTIGNFTPDEACSFLIQARSLLQGGGMLIGVDLLKEETILNAAYNDAPGVTADFNKNLLLRCNSELSANFNLDHFHHSAFLNKRESRIEMHLVSAIDQLVRIDDHSFIFAEGESIHTENSYKYTPEDFQSLAVKAGFKPEKTWIDKNNLFSIHYLAA